MEEEKYANIQAELRTRFELLPEDLQNLIKSSEYQEKLFNIAKKYKWTYEQLGTLELETTMVLLGMTHPEKYADDLAKELNKKPADITPIVGEVKTQVFDTIRASLTKLYSDDSEAVSTTTPAATAPTGDAGVFAKSGIVIEPTKARPASGMATPVTTEEKTVLASSGITLEPQKAAAPVNGFLGNRNSVLSGIENPIKSTPQVLNPVTPPKPSSVPRAPYAASDIVSNKMAGTVAMPPKTTNYTVPKMSTGTTPPPAAPGADPYKEAI